MVTQVTAVIGTNIDEKTGDVLVFLKGDKDQQYALQVARGAVVPLIVTLVGQMQRTHKKYHGPEMQPATLTSVRKIVGDDQYGLELILDGGLPLGVLIHPKDMTALRNVLLELEELTKPKGSSTKAH